MIALSAVLVLLVGTAGVLGLFVTTRSVDRLVDDIEPSRQANDGVLQDLTDADAGIRGWAISGDQAALVPFFDAMDELPDHQSDLERFQPPIDGLDALLESQDQAIDAWVTAYANPRLDAGSGQENYDPALVLRGRREVESRGTELTELDLRAVVLEVVIDLWVVAAGRDVAVEVELPTEPLRVVADQTQILRAVLNVASNAVKFSRPGGWARVVVDVGDGEAEIIVQDNGIGIPEGELVAVGRRFFRGSNAVDQQIAGTGLGIRIVQTIMSRHVGSVDFESVEHQGTTVRLRMPLRGPVSVGAGAATPAVEPA